MYPSRKQNYPLLYSFKQEIELEKNSPENRPYTYMRPSIMYYRIVFLTIGVVYFILAFILMSKSLNWTCSLLFGSSVAVKTPLLMICGAVSTISIYYGLFISTEREAVKMAVSKAKKKLNRLIGRKFSFYMFTSIFHDEQSDALYHQWSKVFDKLDSLQIECIHLVDRIVKSESLEEHQKEELLNQAIIELRFKLESTIDTFEQKYLPILK